MGTLVTFLGSFLLYIAIHESQICGDMGSYSQNNLGHSSFQCVKCPQNLASSLSGEPDYFGRNKISSGGDLSHYSSASLY